MNYLELPVADIGRAKDFYGAAFGFSFADFGGTYSATTSGDTDIGLQADRSQHSASTLPVIEVDDLEATLSSIKGAGGTVTRAIFSFPGGRRFHFRDPDGHELAAMKPDVMNSD